ncbi:MAG: GNAT family N-acetyltransferase [Candidatus Sericytochromatia bacterium]
MAAPYQIQSRQQRELLTALGDFPALVIHPGNPPIAFELMGRVGLQEQEHEDKLLVTSPHGVRQLLSVLWSEFRLVRLDPGGRTLQLSNGQYLILQITNPEGDMLSLTPMLGQMLDLPRPLAQTVKLPLQKGWYLGEIEPRDRAAYILHLNDPAVYRYTLHIPYPYTPDDADQWLALVDSMQCMVGGPSNLAIRNPEGDLCGGIGFIVHGGPPLPHQVEIGYWLGQPYWGQGIMTEAVRVFCHWILQYYGFQRLTAHIFTENTASEKVLLKAGFKLEGLMTHHYHKDGVLHDGKLFAITAGQSSAAMLANSPAL